MECSTNDVAAASLIDQVDRTLNDFVEADLSDAYLHDQTFRCSISEAMALWYVMGI